MSKQNRKIGLARTVGGTLGGFVLWITLAASEGFEQLFPILVCLAWGLGTRLGSRVNSFVNPNSGPSWNCALWIGTITTISVSIFVVPATKWNTLLLGLGACINISYALARFGCLTNGCCWEQKSSKLLLLAYKVTGGPLPRFECLASIGFTYACFFGLYFCPAPVIATIGLSVHPWLRFFGDWHRHPEWLERRQYLRRAICFQTLIGLVAIGTFAFHTHE